MQSKRFKPAVIGLWIISMMLLVQCGPAREAAIDTTPVTLKLITFDVGSTWGKAEEVAINRFRASYPHIEFDRQEFRQFPEAYLTLSPPPDLMAAGANHFLNAAIERGQVVDITDLWEQSGLLQTYPASFQKLSVHEGKQYYLPVGYIWTAIYYNKQVFAQYNLAPPQSWNEFVLICDTLQANDVTPISLSGRNEFQAMLWFDYLDLRLNGPQFHWDLISGLERYDDPRVREVLETWKLLFDSGYFVENPMGVNTLSSLTAIVRGDGGQLGRHKAAMVLADPNAIGELPQPFHAEIDFFRFPVINPSLPMAEVLNSFGYMIPAGGEHIPQTLQFLTFMGSVEAQNLMAQQGNTGFVPTHPGVDPELLTPTLRQGMALVEEAEVVTTPYMFSVPGAIWPVVDNGLRRFLNEPDDKDVESFMLALEAARQDAAAKGLFSSDSLP